MKKINKEKKKLTADYMKTYALQNKEKLAEYQKEYRKNNKDRINASTRKYKQKEAFKKQNKQYESTEAAKELRKIRNKRYREKPENKANKSRAQVTRTKKDIHFKLTCVLRTRLYTALKKNSKSGSAVRDLGCSIQELKAYLESKFYPHPETGEAMSWENHGKCYGTWQIDHIEELHTVDLTNRDELLRVCIFKNLQPLWYEDHIIKGNNYDR